MTEPPDQSFEAVDRLVKSHLDREIERTDATNLLARIRSGPLRASTPVQDPAITDDWTASSLAARWTPSFAWSAMTVVAVIVAFFGSRYLSPATANATSVLRSVRTAHSQSIDRCYRVQYAPDPRYWDGTNKLDGPSESVLATRGDRFWADCTIGDIKLAVGREADGTFWVSPSRSKGIRFPNDASPLPKEVAIICSINAMTVPRLVDDVLAEFDLRAAEPAVNADGATHLVWARVKPGRSHPMLSAALLEIDSENHLLTRLVLWTVRDGRPRGTVTYTLLDTATQGAEQYRLQTHLDPDAKIEIHRFKRAEANDANEEGEHVH